MKRILKILAFLALTSCYISDDVIPDQTIWEYGRPGLEGLSEDDLLDINTRIQINDYADIEGLVIIRNDQIIFENYYNRRDSLGGVFQIPTLSNRNLSNNLGGASLTFALTAIGVAEDKRLLDLDDAIIDYLPGYNDIFQADNNKSAITIRHLLEHKSGLSWDTSIQPFSFQNDLNEMKASSDWVRFILEQAMEAPAGLRFNLNTASGVLLAKVIENVSGQDFETFLKENVLDPLTINTLFIETDPSGNYNAGDGISVSLLDWTKLGYLFINEGIWQGRRVLDSSFVVDATSLQTEISGLYSLGYVWWQFGVNFDQTFGVDHEEIYFIPGEFGQHMYIVPSENMIVSIFAENIFFGFLNPSLTLFTEITYTLQQAL